MSSTERQLGIIKDAILPVDYATRYDLIFTDRRVAIICMGRADREDYGTTGYSPLMGIAPTSAQSSTQKRINQVILEDEVSNLSVSEKLKLSKKSCDYNYEEIEKLKLISGKHPKLIILGKECESKFLIDSYQLKQLNDVIPKIPGLREKLWILQSWKTINSIYGNASISCASCGFLNDNDAKYCQCCGKVIGVNPSNTDSSTVLICTHCGTGNKAPALFCKRCSGNLTPT